MFIVEVFPYTGFIWGIPCSSRIIEYMTLEAYDVGRLCTGPVGPIGVIVFGRPGKVIKDVKG